MLIFNGLGQNLNVLHKQLSRNFTMKTVSMIAAQMLSALEYLHTKGLIHRDVSPYNIVAGAQNSNNVYLIDFGRSKSLFESGRHIPEAEKTRCIVNAWFCGLNVHLYKERSRRDDLQSLAFTLIYLHRGSLPWQQTDLQDNETSHRLKKDLTDDNEALGELLDHSRDIGFETKPDYDLCKTKFNEVLTQPGNTDGVMDWNELSGSRSN